ncbi:trypsin-like serine peptidase [Streptomyces triculaminicus]|uniref:trypsin-like serine peptidase n=1 Tax=Streptomyces triculaminicus TaxID=2816232 RepID=UPI0037BA46AF
MRLRQLALLAAVVAALAAVGLLVAGRVPATGGPTAEGDSTGHFEQPRDQADAAGRAMKATVRTQAPAPLSAPAARGAAGRKDPLPASSPLAAAEAEPSPAIGPLFYTTGGIPAHGCTASVVHSPRGDLIATAAHCVHTGGFRTDIAFVPGYRDGAAPYGVWVPVSVDVAPEWADDRDPDHDVAFLRMRPVEGSARLERVTGAERVRFDPPRERPTRVLGYPNEAERPVSCQNATAAESGTQQRFDCERLPNGTSGSPFLTDVDASTGLGTLAGVLGGKDEGGDEETSYSPYLGQAAKKLYERAAR